MKNTLLSLVLVLTLFLSTSAVRAEEPWKGKPHDSEVTLGAMTGLAIINGMPYYGIVGNFGKKIVHQGFIPDINNQVYLEASVGPVLVNKTAVIIYGLHLRWDFHLDDFWTFYPTAGFGGSFADKKADIGTTAQFFPRFAAGAIWNVFMDFSVRAEISHEVSMLGVSFAI